jgi:hypothetical protein
MSEPHHFRFFQRNNNKKYMQMMHGGRVMVIRSWQVFQT